MGVELSSPLAWPVSSFQLGAAPGPEREHLNVFGIFTNAVWLL